MNNKLLDFCERLPQEACIFVCRIGTGQSLTVFFRAILQSTFENGYKASDKDTVETLVYETIDDMIQELLEIAVDEGFGIEHDTIRLQAYTSDKKPIRSKVLKKEIVEDTDLHQSNAIHSLTLANIRMSEEIRRCMREIANNNKEHLATIQTLSDTLVSSQKEKLQLERENMARELIMEMHDKETGDDTRQQGLSLLERIAHGLFSGQAMQGMDIDSIIKETIKNDPQKVKEFMQDPEIVEAIMKQAMSGEDEETE